MIIVAGDTHGRVDAFARIDAAARDLGVDHVVQVGDCGIAFSQGKNESTYRYFAKRHRQGRVGPTWWTCGGNHDNYNWWNKARLEQGNPDVVKLAPGINWVQRGATITLEGVNYLFMGGAESTDRVWRQEGKSWWPEETPSYAEFSRFAEALETTQPDVVVTHDVPLRVQLYREGRDHQPTPRNLENALKLSGAKPPIWFFGHHHLNQEWDIDGTRFICAGLNGDYWYDDQFFEAPPRLQRPGTV